ncbi:hypothetical protein COV82_01870 [Candidatus Peregrinibacteria bacterium CG11_big_fil_rev_8_21_14_0_20_46_8]|nr:MAG: hypothetical protein COV82_01870 [Candidatus Peregrinibacteria bacterium CG11_big_fil_rev_8_21_14_0_20_46_8]
MRRFTATICAALLLLSSSAQAVFAAEVSDYFPDELSLFIEWKPTGFFKDLIVHSLDAVEADQYPAINNEPLPKSMHLFREKIRTGATISLGMLTEESLAMAFKATRQEWNSIVPDDVVIDNVNGTERFFDTDADGYMVYTGEHIIISEEYFLRSIDGLLSGKRTDRLSADTHFQKILSAISGSGGTENLKAYFNLRNFIDAFKLEEDANPDEFALIESTGNLSPFHGLQINELSNGYSLQYSTIADQFKAEELGIRFDVQNFQPTIQNQLPDFPVLFYTQGANLKGAFEQNSKLAKALSEDGSDPYDQIFALYYGVTGIDFKKFFALEDEFAFVVQYDPATLIPYFTFIAETNETSRTQLVELTETLTALASQYLEALNQSTPGGVDSVLGFDFDRFEPGQEYTKLTIDLASLLEEERSSLPIESLELTFGVTADNYFMISNVPAIEKQSTRSGLVQGHELLQFINSINSPDLNGLFFADLRKIWDYIDEYIENDGLTDEFDLEMIQGYYAFMEEAYAWKTLSGYSEGLEFETHFSGSLTKDNAQHASYASFIEKLKKSDRDNDGYTDYNELFINKTPLTVDDSDGDGYSDVYELKAGWNPNVHGKAPIFSDVASDTFYTRDVALLNRRGALSGYPDGTFQPGRFVNRAEFTTMVMRALREYNGDRFSSGYDLDTRRVLYGNLFADIQGDEWFAPVVIAAQQQGIVAGGTNANGERTFRPGDSITRAEAIAIINKASKMLNKDLNKTSCSGERAFIDVPPDIWYCPAVTNAYNKGITAGRGDGLFAPNGLLNRAEAAVMIQRALEGDIEFTSTNMSLEDLVGKNNLFEKAVRPFTF